MMSSFVILLIAIATVRKNAYIPLVLVAKARAGLGTDVFESHNRKGRLGGGSGPLEVIAKSW